MFSKQSIYLSFVLYSNIFNVASWRPFYITIYNPTYTVDFPNIINFNLTANDDILSMYLDVLIDIYQPFLHIEYFFDSGNGKYDLLFANKTLNTCTFLANRRLDILMQIILKTGEKYGELPHQCPLRKKLFYIKNMKIDTEYFPPVLPEKNGIIKFSFLMKVQGKLKILLNASVFFKIENTFKRRQQNN